GGAGVFGLTVSPDAAGVFGSNNGSSGVGVQGNGPTAGVRGFSDQGDGAFTQTGSSSHVGLFGNNISTDAASGGGAGGAGVFGLTVSPDAAGVFGSNNGSSGVGVQGSGPTAGVSGFSESGNGVRAFSNHGDAIAGFANESSRNGIFGRNSATNAAPSGHDAPIGNGVFGFTDVPNASGVVGAVAATNTDGAGVCGIGPIAGRFFGDVIVTGDVQLTGADLAEHFETAGTATVEPGTVMVIDGVDQVRVSDTPYDQRVAGVVSGAGEYQPGVVLDHQGAVGSRQPLALVGKVNCKVDASFGPVQTGDLLTTSLTPGHAMRADDAARSYGAVLGKAMAPLTEGTGLLPVLVTLH
ncbi:hypothetical protein ABZY06_21935, partial [Streptomyces sp. NPDC006540]|uniref:hypothetical protein n=1 Tax=Streptomyces sp. NPDC006540 TaxID=3155353 RepID=UPI0033A5867E